MKFLACLITVVAVVLVAIFTAKVTGNHWFVFLVFAGTPIIVGIAMSDFQLGESGMGS